MGEIAFLVLLLAAGGYYYWETFTYPQNIYERSGGPGIFPRAVIIILAIFVVIRIIQIISSREKRHFQFFEVFKGSTGVFFFSLLFYIVLMKPLGYLIDTLLFGLFLTNYLYYIKHGNKGRTKDIVLQNLIIVIVAIGLHLFFYRYLHILLPKGLLKSIL